jgi:IclR family transcriptional regulator, acetate operon repressor
MTATVFADGQHARQIESVQRALQLLRLFVDEDLRSGLGVTEAGKILGVGKSTASRLLATMAAARIVVLDEETRRYFVGPLAFELGNRFEGANLARALQPVIRDLADRAQCTAQLGTLQGFQMLYLAVAQGSSRLRVVASPGDLRYVHASAMGKALLAALSDARQGELISSMVDADGTLPASGPNTIRDPRKLRETLAEIRARGYSTSDEEAERGIAAIGVAVPYTTDFPLALSLAFPTNQFDDSARPQLIAYVLEATEAIHVRLTASR